MTTIWKFEISKGDAVPVVEMPAGAKILSVGIQGSKVMAWAMVDPEAATEMVRFRISGTGHLADPAWNFIGTCFDGPFVWHIFTE